MQVTDAKKVVNPLNNKNMEKQKFYLVIAFSRFDDSYTESWLFKEKFEAEKFQRHYDWVKEGNDVFIYEKELIE